MLEYTLKVNQFPHHPHETIRLRNNKLNQPLFPFSPIFDTRDYELFYFPFFSYYTNKQKFEANHLLQYFNFTLF